MQYHISWNQEHKKWVLKSNDTDLWIRSSYYKILCIRKSAKYCKNLDHPTQLVIHLKDGHIEEVRDYHKESDRNG